MAGKQVTGSGDGGLASNLAGMSKTQLYDIMSQMKSLIEQNQQQAKHILIQNPLLTRALFQAQIMLGMVQPPQAVPSIQPQASQQSHPIQQANVPAAHTIPSYAGVQDQGIPPQAQAPMRKQQQIQPSMPISSAPAQSFHSQGTPSQPIEVPRGHINATNQMPPLQSSQVPNMPSVPRHSGPQPPSFHQPSMPPGPGHMQQPPMLGHMQQSMQTGGVSHHTLQGPPPLQPRPPLQVQYQPSMGPNMNFPNSGIPQMPHSQTMYHPSVRPSSGTGSSYPQGQQPHLNQMPHQTLYQGGASHLGTDFGGQGGNVMQMERGSPWPPASRENPAGPLPLGPGQMPMRNQPPQSPSLSPDMQQALQQVMSLTPEQINDLPDDQRQQVLQLQQMLRQHQG